MGVAIGQAFFVQKEEEPLGVLQFCGQFKRDKDKLLLWIGRTKGTGGHHLAILDPDSLTEEIRDKAPVQGTGVLTTQGWVIDSIEPLRRKPK